MNKNERIIELMKENGLNASDEKSFLTIAVVYTEAQADYMREQLEEIK